MIGQKSQELKKDLLRYWVQEQERELGLFQRAAHVDTGTISPHLSLEERMRDLQLRFNYMIDGKPRSDPMPLAIKQILDGRFPACIKII